jgi:hypothetical protein
MTEHRSGKLNPSRTVNQAALSQNAFGRRKI